MINYITQVSVCWGLFYLLYAIWLRKETFFNVNRWYLLLTLIVGLIIPLIEFNVPVNTNSGELLDPAYYIETITVTAQTFENNLEEIVITPVNESIGMQLILISIYWLGVLFFSGRFLYGISQIFRLAYRGKIIRKKDFTLVKTMNIHLPFSFMDYLFWSEKVSFSNEDHKKILRHELCHIKGNHSIDVLILEFLNILLWCSPFIYLYKKALKNVHEYLADDAVLQDTPTKKYGQLLLRQSQSGLQIAQANNFIHSQLKKRILMMTRNKSQRTALLKYTAMLPLLLFLVFSISAKNDFGNIIKPAKGISAVNHPVDTLKPIVDDGKGAVFQVVEEMPRFAGCEDIQDAQVRKECAKKKMLMHIYTNIKYPPQARESHIQGTVIASFIIEKDGSVTNAKILRGIGGGCDEEVVRIVNNMPNFLPGKQRGQNVRVQFNLPVKFKLDNGVKSEAQKASDPQDTSLSGFDKESAIFYLDGKRIQSIDDVDPDQILTITVLKNEEAIELYGPEAKGGVVLITSKKTLINVIGYAKEKSAIGYIKEQAVPPSPPEEPTHSEPGSPPSAISAAPPSPEPIPEKAVPPSPPAPSEPLPPVAGISASPPSPPPPVKDQLFIAEEMPLFPGTKEKSESNEALIQFVYQNIKYPKAAKEAKIQGTSIVQFTVTKEGEIYDPKIVRSIGGGTDEAVLNMMQKMSALPKKWTPAKQGGKVVAIQFNLPVKFKLPNTPANPESTSKANELSSFEKINIYPNPTEGNINIHFSSKNESPTTVTITDINGKQIFQKIYNGKEVKINDLEIRNAASGILMISFEQDGKITTKEVLLQR